MRNGLIINKNGDRFWYKNGLVHREDGPACEWFDCGKGWCINGKYHREDGPAMELEDVTQCWWLDDVNYGHEKPNNWHELVLKARAKRLYDL
jgi:hypothetical protein